MDHVVTAQIRMMDRMRERVLTMFQKITVIPLVVIS